MSEGMVNFEEHGQEGLRLTPDFERSPRSMAARNRVPNRPLGPK